MNLNIDKPRKIKVIASKININLIDDNIIKQTNIPKDIEQYPNKLLFFLGLLPNIITFFILINI